MGLTVGTLSSLPETKGYLVCQDGTGRNVDVAKQRMKVSKWGADPVEGYVNQRDLASC